MTFVGITCGLSAPYVAGQIAHALDNPDNFNHIGLIGHNPPDLARDDTIENWPRGTFRSVLADLAKSERAMIMTPVLGGETITGSSRMKGGSGTLITLQTAFVAALEFILEGRQEIDNHCIERILGYFQYAVAHLYKQNSKSLQALINVYGECLNANGNVRYLGHNNYGVLALIDSSECPPTYGATFEDIRGFIYDGWQEMDNKKSELEMCKEGHEELNITLEDCFAKEQSEKNVHIVIDFDKHPGLRNAVTRFEEKAEGRIVIVGLESGANEEKNDIPFRLANHQDLKFDETIPLTRFKIECLRYLQCKLGSGLS